MAKIIACDNQPYYKTKDCRGELVLPGVKSSTGRRQPVMKNLKVCCHVEFIATFALAAQCLRQAQADYA